MYLSSEKPTPIDFYKEEGSSTRDMMLEVLSNSTLQHIQQQQQQMLLERDSTSGDGEDHEIKAPKKRAETWIQDETRCLLSLRREMDRLFNTSKSNKHLWEQISSKMRDKGFDRSPTMCTDKWRNLLKEFKKARHQERGSGSGKIAYYKELEELLRERVKNGPCKTTTTTSSKVDSFGHFSERGPDDANMPFGPVEASGRSTLNLESRLDHEGHPLAIAATDGVAASGVPPWNWRETNGNGEFSKLNCQIVDQYLVLEHVRISLAGKFVGVVTFNNLHITHRHTVFALLFILRWAKFYYEKEIHFLIAAATERVFVLRYIFHRDSLLNNGLLFHVN